tara:strand:+ start:734 stop:1210 length:477 start_codon:yes stop_codon:yes gene_type:complete
MNKISDSFFKRCIFLIKGNLISIDLILVFKSLIFRKGNFKNINREKIMSPTIGDNCFIREEDSIVNFVNIGRSLLNDENSAVNWGNIKVEIILTTTKNMIIKKQGYLKVLAICFLRFIVNSCCERSKVSDWSKEFETSPILIRLRYSCENTLGKLDND